MQLFFSNFFRISRSSNFNFKIPLENLIFYSVPKFQTQIIFWKPIVKKSKEWKKQTLVNDRSLFENVGGIILWKEIVRIFPHISSAVPTYSSKK